MNVLKALKEFFGILIFNPIPWDQFLKLTERERDAEIFKIRRATKILITLSFLLLIGSFIILVLILCG